MLTIGAESFPTESRGVGIAISNVCARIGGIGSPIITGLLLEYNNGFQLCMIIYSVCFLLCGISFLLMKETKLKPKKIQTSN